MLRPQGQLAVNPTRSAKVGQCSGLKAGEWHWKTFLLFHDNTDLNTDGQNWYQQHLTAFGLPSLKSIWRPQRSKRRMHVLLPELRAPMSQISWNITCSLLDHSKPWHTPTLPSSSPNATVRPLVIHFISSSIPRLPVLPRKKVQECLPCVPRAETLAHSSCCLSHHCSLEMVPLGTAHVHRQVSKEMQQTQAFFQWTVVEMGFINRTR